MNETDVLQALAKHFGTDVLGLMDMLDPCLLEELPPEALIKLQNTITLTIQRKICQ